MAIRLIEAFRHTTAIVRTSSVRQRTRPGREVTRQILKCADGFIGASAALSAALPAGAVDTVVEAVDLLPTILERLGLPPRPELDGVSLLPTLNGRPPAQPSYALSEFLDDQRALMVGRWKLLPAAAAGADCSTCRPIPPKRRTWPRRPPSPAGCASSIWARR